MGASLVSQLDDQGRRSRLRFFLTDALGTVRDVVDDTGAVIQSYEFSEHGLPMPGSGASSGTFAPKTYQGALSVNDDRADSGLYLMGHRHYAPELGRFISRDPIGFKGGLNLFGRHGVSPVTMVDPTGLEVTAVFDIATGTMTVTSTEGHKRVYTGIKCGASNDPSDIYRSGASTPPGTYYLGEPVSAARTHPDNTGDLMWIPILNPTTLGDQVFVTDPETGKVVERNAMFVHAGRRSDGCLTFPSTGREGELINADFSELKEILANTSGIYTGHTELRFSPTGTHYIMPVMMPGRLIVK